MDVQEFRQNRARFPLRDLMNFRGQWVAFSSDGRRVVASSDDLEMLEALVIAAGEDPEQTAYERFEFEDVHLGSAEQYG